MFNQVILKNTLALYVRQIVMIMINLYAFRIVFISLGIDDFGVYTTVAGLVTLLSFLPASMASATQRFFAYALGQQDELKLKKTFSVNLLLYAAIASISLLLFQSIGTWFVTDYLVLPDNRHLAALNTFRLVAYGFVVTMFAAPFIAILIAHEDIHLYALISTVDALLKLSAALLLDHVQGDVLELYGSFLLLAALLTTSSYIATCLNRYAECQFRRIYWDKALLQEIVEFTGWTVFGQLSTVFRNQAVTVLISQMFNPATVAARAVALIIASQVQAFAVHLNTGLYPSIIKSYAANQTDEMFALILNGSKLTYFMMWVFALPLLVEMENVLSLWLNTPPSEAILFSRLALIESLILCVSLPITTAARAPGKMKLYELTLGSIQISIFVISWLVLEAGQPPASVFVVAIIASLIIFLVRLLIVKKLISMPLSPYCRKVLVPLGMVTLASSIPSLLLKLWTDDGLLASVTVVAGSVTFASLAMYYLGLDRMWRKRIKRYLISIFFQVNARK